MAEKIVIQLEVDAGTGKATIQGLENEVSKAQKSTSKAGDEMFDLNQKVDDVSKGALTMGKNIVGGIKSAVKSMGALKLAIAATGIGLLVTIAAALVEYFTNFEKPLKAVDTVMNAIGGAINAIVESFGKLVAGDFIGFFSDVADGAMNAVQATDDLYKAQERIYDLQKATIVQNAELRASVEENLKIAADTTLSLEERLMAQEKVNQSAEQLIQNERELTAVELERLQAELAIENNYERRRELEIQIQQTTADLINIEASLNRQRLDAAKSEREIIAQDKALKDAELKEEKDRIEAAIQARLDAIEKIRLAVTSSTENEIIATRAKYDELIALAQKYGQDTVELERARREELAQFDLEKADDLDPMAKIQAKLEEERTLQMETLAIRQQARTQDLANQQAAAAASKKIDQITADAKLSVAASVANSVASLVGEQTAAGKAAAVAATTIATYQSATNAFNSLSGIPIVGPVLGGVAAAAAVVAGIANVKKILSVKVPGKGGSSGGGAGISAPSVSAPSVGNSIGLINPVGNAQGIGDGISSTLEQNPPRAYVVSEDVVSGVDLDNKIRSNGQFG